MADHVDVVKKTTNVTVRGGASRVITLDRKTVAEIERNRPRPVEVHRPTPVVVQDRRTTVKAGGGMGIQGAPGETEGATFLATCGATVHGDRVVRIANDTIFEADPSSPSDAQEVIGIATQAGAINTQVLVRTAGQMSDGSWNWSPGLIWCGINGQLTQSPASGWLLVVARALDATTIEVTLGEPIMRS